MLRRGMFAGDTGLLQDVRPPFDDGLAALATSRMFREVAGPDFVAFVEACYAQRQLPLANGTAGNNSAVGDGSAIGHNGVRRDGTRAGDR